MLEHLQSHLLQPLPMGWQDREDLVNMHPVCETFFYSRLYDIHYADKEYLERLRAIKQKQFQAISEYRAGINKDRERSGKTFLTLEEACLYWLLEQGNSFFDSCSFKVSDLERGFIFCGGNVVLVMPAETLFRTNFFEQQDIDFAELGVLDKLNLRRITRNDKGEMVVSIEDEEPSMIGFLRGICKKPNCPYVGDKGLARDELAVAS